jgi:macrolide transport system ATP-binding/permease protein
LPAQLALHGVTKSYDHRVVLDHVDLTVPPGEHAAVVGDNGAGKSTLLRLAAGAETPDDGEVTVTSPGGVGHLDQALHGDAPPPGRTVRDAVDDALAGLRAIEHRLRELEADLTPTRLEEYGDLLTAYEARGGYEADARVDAALSGLGVGHLTRDRPLTTLSGGERARLALACLLAAAPETLLLDEPTGHLDPAATAWLEDRLRAHRGTVLVVSHDRLFLERVATAIYEVAEGRVTRYGGGYAGFLAAKAAARVRWEQEYAAWREEIRRVEVWAATTAYRVAPGRPMKDRNKPAYDRDAGRVQSSVAGRVRQARERLRQLHRHPVPRPPDPLRFDGLFTGAAGHDGPVATLREVRVGDRLHVGELTIDAGERLLLQGANGAGKSTLLAVLAGHRPDAGTVRVRGPVAHLPQEIAVRRPRRSVLAAFADGRSGDPGELRERLLSYGLFHPDTLGLPVGALSQGQLRRLALARLLGRPVALLLLDEPTNHLAPTLAEELDEALAHYRGALVVVSHDRALAGRFTGRRIELRGGRLAGEREESRTSPG